jgi:hypothetical protein
VRYGHEIDRLMVLVMFQYQNFTHLNTLLTKEVLKIVNPNLYKEYQAAQNSHNDFIINPSVIKKADKIKTKGNGPRQSKRYNESV